MLYMWGATTVNKGALCKRLHWAKKVHLIFSYMSEACVSSFLFLTEFNPLWVVDSWAADYVTKDHGTFVDLWRVSDEERWIYVGNNVRILVKGIGTCKLVLRGG